MPGRVILYYSEHGNDVYVDGDVEVLTVNYDFPPEDLEGDLESFVEDEHGDSCRASFGEGAHDPAFDRVWRHFRRVVAARDAVDGEGAKP